MAQDLVCPHAPSIDANDLGTKECSSVRRGLLSPSSTVERRTGWLGREGSNLRMAESKSAALPLGYAPTGCPGTRAGSSLRIPSGTAGL